MKEAIEKSRNNLESIKSVPKGGLDYENCVMAFDESTMPIDIVYTRIAPPIYSGAILLQSGRISRLKKGFSIKIFIGKNHAFRKFFPENPRAAQALELVFAIYKKRANCRSFTFWLF